MPPAAVKFVQSGDTEKNKTVPGNDGRSFPEVTCYRCQKTGRYAKNCTSSTANTHTGSKSIQVELTMNQTTNYLTTTNIINPNCILLDTWLTISSVRNKNLVQSIQPCDAVEELNVYTNGGHQNYDHTTTLKHLPFEKKLMRNPREHTFLFRSFVQVQDYHWHRIEPIRQCTPSQWHKDDIQEMRGRSILFWHNKQGFCQRPNHRLHLY